MRRANRIGARDRFHPFNRPASDDMDNEFLFLQSRKFRNLSAEDAVAQRSMLTHADIWNAVDRLAARAGLSASGLAKKAGLDPTTFNKSKRITPEGRPRWPSTESIAKSLQATGVTVDIFVSLITDRGGASTQAVPLIGLAEAGAGGYFDDGGFPAGKGWDEIAFPAVNDEHVYALEVSGDSMQPAYRDGTVIVVSPAAPIRRGDRVVVKTARRRGHGEGAQAPHRQIDRAALAQSDAHGAHALGRRCAVDRAHHVGESVAPSRAPRAASRRAPDR